MCVCVCICVCLGLKGMLGKRIELPDMRILLLTPRAPILVGLKTVATNSGFHHKWMYCIAQSVTMIRLLITIAL